MSPVPRESMAVDPFHRVASLLLHSWETAYQAPKPLHRYPFVWFDVATRCAYPLNRAFENLTLEYSIAEAPLAAVNCRQQGGLPYLHFANLIGHLRVGMRSEVKELQRCPRCSEA